MPIFFARPNKIGEKKWHRSRPLRHRFRGDSLRGASFSQGACESSQRGQGLRRRPRLFDTMSQRRPAWTWMSVRRASLQTPTRLRPLLSRIAFRSQPSLGDPALPDEEPRDFWLRPQRRKQTGAGKERKELLFLLVKTCFRRFCSLVTFCFFRIDFSKTSHCA